MRSRLLLLAILATCWALHTTVQAQDKYDLRIANVQVTSENCNDLSVISGVSGTVHYAPDTKTLTLEDATINASGNNVINSEIVGLTIKVSGTNNLTNTRYAAFYFTKPMSIVGQGTLNVECLDDAALFANEATLTIDGCTMHAKGKKFGLAGAKVGRVGKELIIRNAMITAEGTSDVTKYATIANFSTLTLEGCTITEPAGAVFDASLKGIALNGEIVKSKVVITKIGTGINIPVADEAIRKNGMYTLDGVRISGELSELPKGIYIVNGQKVVRK